VRHAELYMPNVQTYLNRLINNLIGGSGLLGAIAAVLGVMAQGSVAGESKSNQTADP
jgi:hypothetical protein